MKNLHERLLYRCITPSTEIQKCITEYIEIILQENPKLGSRVRFSAVFCCFCDYSLYVFGDLKCGFFGLVNFVFSRGRV